MNSYLKESKEFQPVVVTMDGAPILSGHELAMVPRGTRPTVWLSPVTINDRNGLMIEGLTPGVYEIFVKIIDMPEIPVISAGSVVIR